MELEFWFSVEYPELGSLWNPEVLDSHGIPKFLSKKISELDFDNLSSEKNKTIFLH
jgi:hypothetical protein